MILVEVAKRQYQSLNGFGLIETFLGMIDLTAWLWGWNVRVNGMQSVFSFSAVFNADCRSICWARYEILRSAFLMTTTLLKKGWKFGIMIIESFNIVAIFCLHYEWKDKFCIVSERIWKFQIGHWFETWQKHRQLFDQKFISNQWPTWNFQMRSLTMQNLFFHS